LLCGRRAVAGPGHSPHRRLADKYTQESAFDAGVFFFCFEAEILENLAGPCGAPTYLPTYLPYLRETKKEIICWVKVETRATRQRRKRQERENDESEWDDREVA